MAAIKPALSPAQTPYELKVLSDSNAFTIPAAEPPQRRP
jgi:hypothetical protein